MVRYFDIPIERIDEPDWFVVRPGLKCLWNLLLLFGDCGENFGCSTFRLPSVRVKPWSSQSPLFCNSHRLTTRLIHANNLRMGDPKKHRQQRNTGLEETEYLNNTLAHISPFKLVFDIFVGLCRSRCFAEACFEFRRHFINVR